MEKMKNLDGSDISNQSVRNGTNKPFLGMEMDGH